MYLRTSSQKYFSFSVKIVSFFLHLPVEMQSAAENSREKSISIAAEPQAESWAPNHSRGPELNSTLQEAGEAGLFSGKSFLLVGFGTEAEAQLSMLVTEHGGKMLNGRPRVVADYAVVPLLGCSVEATVDEVVTDTWLVSVLRQIRAQSPSLFLISVSACLFSGHVCGEGVCFAALLQPFVHPCSCEGRIFSSQRLCSLSQSIHWSRKGVFGGAGKAHRSQV